MREYMCKEFPYKAIMLHIYELIKDEDMTAILIESLDIDNNHMIYMVYFDRRLQMYQYLFINETLGE
jgi:hypothetical protein